jgi:hypothetical protein
MAYTQKPGRGNGPKTGGGLPAQLNSGSTNAIDPVYSSMPDPGAFAKDSDKMSYDERKSNASLYNPKSEKFVKEPLGGVAYDEKSKQYVPKPVTAKFEKGLGTGKPIAFGTTNLHVGKNFVGNVRKGSDIEKETYSRFVSDSLDTTADRRVRALEYNQKMKNLPAPNKEFYNAANAANEKIKNKTIQDKIKKGTVIPREEYKSRGEAGDVRMRHNVSSIVNASNSSRLDNMLKRPGQ